MKNFPSKFFGSPYMVIVLRTMAEEVRAFLERFQASL